MDIMETGDIIKLSKEASKFHTCPEGRKNHRTAKILSASQNGRIFTDRDLRGCRHWHVTDVELAKSIKK